MRWLVSREHGLDPADMSTRRVAADPWGEVPPLPELVGVFPTRTAAADAVEGDDPDFWKLLSLQRAPVGWESWSKDDDGSWTRWRLQAIETGIDVNPVPPGVDPEWLLSEQRARRELFDPLVAAQTGDPEAMRRAVLEHGLGLARADGDDQLADDIVIELTRLDLEDNG